MRNWQRLFESGMAEIVSPKVADPYVDRLIEQLNGFFNEPQEEVMAFVRLRCEVVRFKKGATIIDYREHNPQILFRESGKVKVFKRIDRHTDTCICSSQPEDRVFATHFNNTRYSAIRILVIQPAIFTTLRWLHLVFVSPELRGLLDIASRLMQEYEKSLEAWNNRTRITLEER